MATHRALSTPSKDDMSLLNWLEDKSCCCSSIFYEHCSGWQDRIKLRQSWNGQRLWEWNFYKPLQNLKHFSCFNPFVIDIKETTRHSSSWYRPWNGETRCCRIRVSSLIAGKFGSEKDLQLELEVTVGLLRLFTPACLNHQHWHMYLENHACELKSDSILL